MDLVEEFIFYYNVPIMLGATFGTGCGCHLGVAYGAPDRHMAAEGIGRLSDGLRGIA